MIWTLWAAIALVITELVLALVIRKARGSFSWVITEADEVPKLDKIALEKFIQTSFDPRLGWVRKPNSSGIERGKNGDINYEIDAIGSRYTKLNSGLAEVAAFGDSYTFCRQVEDDETWEAQLASIMRASVLNFGVGNYGVDQALLRYEETDLPDSVRIVVMGFVPETICRIHSYWKHYLEFGNTFAFKPRFVLGPTQQLTLLENPIEKPDDFGALAELLPVVRTNDFFYQRKFKSLQFRFPYLLSFLRWPRRHVHLLSVIAWRGLSRLFERRTERSENLPFTLVMKENILDAHSLYGDQSATALLLGILKRFKESAVKRGHVPLIVVMPQLFDIKLTRSSTSSYEAFYLALREHIPVLDMTKTFTKHNVEELYINDQYGGHLSSTGNLLVAREIAAWIDTIDRKGDKK